MRLKKKKSISPSLLQLISRRMVLYPSSRHRAILTALCYDEERKKADLLKEIVAVFINKIPESKQNMLLALYKEMTPEQRTYPYKTAKERF